MLGLKVEEHSELPPLRWKGWRFAVAMYILAVAGCAFISFLLGPLLGIHEWFFSEDVWYTTNSSQYAINGGAGAVYAANPYFAALPGFIYLYAPVVGIAEHFGFVPGYPIVLPKPSMLLVIGPFFFLCGATAVLGMDYLMETLQVAALRRRIVLAGVAIFVVAPTPGFAGHPEDLLALALVCTAVSLLIRKRLTGAGLLLAASVLMQTWAGLLIPVFLAACPPGQRVRMLVRSSAAPAVMGLCLLALDFKDAATDLLRQPMLNAGQHLPWWGLASHFTVTNLGTTFPAVSGSTTRTLAVVVAAIAALWVARRPTPEAIVFASAVATYARCFFEVEFWPYYVAPAAVLFVVLGSRTTSGDVFRFVALCATAFLLYVQSAPGIFGIRVSPWLALAILGAAGVLCAALSRPRGAAAAAPLTGPAQDSTQLELSTLLDCVQLVHGRSGTPEVVLNPGS